MRHLSRTHLSTAQRGVRTGRQPSAEESNRCDTARPRFPVCTGVLELHRERHPSTIVDRKGPSSYSRRQRLRVSERETGGEREGCSQAVGSSAPVFCVPVALSLSLLPHTVRAVTEWCTVLEGSTGGCQAPVPTYSSLRVLPLVDQLAAILSLRVGV